MNSDNRAKEQHRPTAYRAFEQTWLAELAPAGLLELEAFHDFLRAAWHKREVIEALSKLAAPFSDAAAARQLDRLHRYERDFECRASRALRELRRLRRQQVEPALPPLTLTEDLRTSLSVPAHESPPSVLAKTVASAPPDESAGGTISGRIHCARILPMNGSLQRRFDEDGFLVVRGFLDEDDVGTLRAAWESFQRDIAPALDKRQVMYEDYQDRLTIKQSNALHLEPRFDAWRFGGKVHDLAVSLIGPVSPQYVEYFDKPPGNNRPTPPHQDGYYFCLRPNVACTVWIPLEPIDASNGALTYIRGSHKLGVRGHDASSILGFSQGLAEDPAPLGEQVLCPVEPGDVLVHHSLTIHMAGKNHSATQRRRAIGYVFFSASATRDEVAWARYEASLLHQHQAKGIVT